MKIARCNVDKSSGSRLPFNFYYLLTFIDKRTTKSNYLFISSCYRENRNDRSRSIFLDVFAPPDVVVKYTNTFPVAINVICFCSDANLLSLSLSL